MGQDEGVIGTVIFAIGFLIGSLLGAILFIYFYKRWAINDFTQVLALVSDLIQLHHWITLDIRFLFHSQLSYLLFMNPIRTREEWEVSIKNRISDWSVKDFILRVAEDKRFRKDIINVLLFEREKIITEQNRVISEKRRLTREQMEVERKKLYATIYGEDNDQYVERKYSD